MPDNAMHDRQMDDRQRDPYVSMWRFASLAQLKHKTAEQSDRRGMANLVFSTGTLKSSLLKINSKATKKGLFNLLHIFNFWMYMKKVDCRWFIRNVKLEYCIAHVV